MEYAIAKLIIAMGMFIHDLSELKNGTDEVYTESSYDDLAYEIMHNV